MILALDLEGTLISNVVSQIPRPGLLPFLEICPSMFARLVIFSSVPEDRFRTVAMSLASRGEAPQWFVDLECVRWEGRYKRLHFVSGAQANEVILLDDMPQYIHPDDLGHWIPVVPFLPPYSPSDRELERVLSTLTRLSETRISDGYGQ